MFQFINYLKMLAAILITNSHYSNIWPISFLALGGHIGNCIFFLVSGFCLYNIKDSILVWYSKRIKRIYPSLWVAVIFNILLGKFTINGLESLFNHFIYPTWYHFIASIMVLYLVYYIVRLIQNKFKINTIWFILGLFIIYFILYILSFDKSYYHIDAVEENWCRFQFFASMLLGGLLREKYDVISNDIKSYDLITFFILLISYFVGKVALSKLSYLSSFQCFLPIILVGFVFSIAILFIKLEKIKFYSRFHKKINKIVDFISNITLEIYLGQFLILDSNISNIIFPLNFIVVTLLILLYGWIIHKCSSLIQKGICNIIPF